MRRLTKRESDLQEPSLFIQGLIDEATVGDVGKFLGAQGSGPVKIMIESPGGCAYSSNLIVGLITSYRGHVTTVSLGRTCSSGFHIFLAGDTRIATEFSVFMSHRVQSGDSVGDVHNRLECRFHHNWDLNFLMTKIRDASTGEKLPREEVEALFLTHQERWFLPPLALKYNIATHYDRKYKKKFLLDF